MIVLGRLKTDLGAIELDYSSGLFTTSRVYSDALTGEPRPSIILMGRASAAEWYGLMADKGAVYTDFPELTPERITP